MFPKQFPCVLCTNKAFRSWNHLAAHNRNVHTEKIPCPTCKKEFAKQNFHRHLETHLPGRERSKLKCTFGQCSKEYFEKSNLKRHIVEDHSSIAKQKCGSCSKEYSSTSALKWHIRQRHSGAVAKFECPLCDAVFRSKYGQQYHILVAHTGEKSFQCLKCPLKFPAYANLHSHQFVHNDAKPHRCKICHKGFNLKAKLNSHFKNAHTQRTPGFRCSICERAFFAKSSMNQHQRIHSLIVGRFSCYFCPKRFITKSELGCHLRIHTQEKPFSCSEDACQYSGSNSDHLRRHNKIHHSPAETHHSPNKTWTCYFCNKTKSSIYHLTDHIRNHTQEEPFNCNLCQRSFKSRGRLQTHVYSHTKEKPFRCPYCPKFFNSNTKMNVHTNAVHAQEKRFFCEICSYASFTKCGLKRHHLWRHLHKTPIN